MLTLTGTQALEASATAATTVTYTVMGLLANVAAPPVAQAYEVLAQGQVASSVGSIYSPGASASALISAIYLQNTNGSTAQTVNVYVDGTAGSNQIMALSIPAGGGASYEDGGGWTITNSAGLPVTTGVSSVTNADGMITPSPTTGSVVLSSPQMAAFFDNQWYNVTAHGVLPSNTAAANVTALNSLLSSAPAGSVIYFPGGTYSFNAKITVPAKALIFRGAGGAGITGGFTILQWTSNVADNLIQLTSGNWYSQFYDLVIATTVNQTAGAAIAFNSNVATHIKNCSFGALGGTLFNVLDFTGNNASEETVVDTVTMSGFTGTGINVNANLSSPMIVNTNINGQWGTATQTATACCQIQNAGAVQIDNSDFIGANNNLLINPTTGIVVASVYVTNTYFDNSNGSCIKITGAGATVRCRFISCSITTASATTGLSGVEISSTFAYTANGQGLDFENCSIINTFGTTGTTNGFLITGAADFTIAACRIAGWTNGIQVTPAVAAGITKPFIDGNTIGPTAGYGANTVGILLNAGSFQYGPILIENNQLNGNTTSLTDNSTQALSSSKIVAGNNGLPTAPNPIIAASAAINTTETYIPTAIALPANSLRAGQQFRLTLFGTCTSTAANVSTFTFRVGTSGTVPGSDTVQTFAQAVTAAATGTNIPFRAVFDVTVRSGGATTNLEISTAIHSNGTGINAQANSLAVAAMTAFSSTSALFLNVSYKSAATTTTCTFQQALWEVVQQ